MHTNYKKRAAATIFLLFFPFFYIHRKALTEPATTVVQPSLRRRVAFGLRTDRLWRVIFLDRKFVSRWVLFSEGDEG